MILPAAKYALSSSMVPTIFWMYSEHIFLTSTKLVFFSVLKKKSNSVWLWRLCSGNPEPSQLRGRNAMCHDLKWGDSHHKIGIQEVHLSHEGRACIHLEHTWGTITFSSDPSGSSLTPHAVWHTHVTVWAQAPFSRPCPVHTHLKGHFLTHSPAEQTAAYFLTSFSMQIFCTRTTFLIFCLRFRFVSFTLYRTAWTTKFQKHTDKWL